MTWFILDLLHGHVLVESNNGDWIRALYMPLSMAYAERYVLVHTEA